MTIAVKAEGFTGSFQSVNGSALFLNVNTLDVARAAATVGGPVVGTPWARTQRRAGLVLTVLSSLSEAGPNRHLVPSTLFEKLESTEKGGVSFRLGMAMAAVVAEDLLSIDVLEHLHPGNTILAPGGGKRRADLFGLDSADDCHVIEAKGRTHGYGDDLRSHAKAQAENISIVDTKAGAYKPVTRSASITDLSQRPIHVLLADPAGGPSSQVPYEIDTEAVLDWHYSAVRDLIEVTQRRQSPPRDHSGDVIGSYLPGTEFWLGLPPLLFEPSVSTWRDRIEEIRSTQPANHDLSSSNGRDGHVLQLGPRLSELYESWRVSSEPVGEIERGTDDPEID